MFWCDNLMEAALGFVPERERPRQDALPSGGELVSLRAIVLAAPGFDPTVGDERTQCPRQRRDIEVAGLSKLAKITMDESIESSENAVLRNLHPKRFEYVVVHRRGPARKIP